MYVQADFERLVHEAALRSLDKQERLLEELRARTGLLLAASSVAASFLGQEAFRSTNPVWLMITALASFVACTGACVFVLLPRRDLAFAGASTTLYERLYPLRHDMPEVLRHLTYNLSALWAANDRAIIKLSRAYSVAAGALVAEILSLSALLAATIV